MDISKAFPSKYLKGTDFAAPAQYTIQNVSIVSMQDGSNKPAITFAETQLLLILNKTNSATLATLLGNETTGWAGHKIELFAEPCTFQGRTLQAIRVRTPSNGVATSDSGATVATGSPVATDWD